MTIAEALSWAKALLSSASDADYLLCECIGQTRSYLYTWTERPLTEAQYRLFVNMVERRKTGEPIAYIMGKKAFWTLTLATSTDTLIPREETEVLVAAALEKLTTYHFNTVCDLGTGTGAVALAIASENPEYRVVGIDYVEGAVALAQQNAKTHGIANATFFYSNWFSQLANQRFDVIVSNPPYVEQHSPYLQQGDLRFEPDTALVSGNDGLDDIKLIIDKSSNHLQDNGWLLFEHGYTQHTQVANLMDKAGFVDIHAVADLNQQQRVTCGKWQPKS